MTAKLMWTGPTVDGRATYFTLGRDIPQGWDRRRGQGSWATERQSYVIRDLVGDDSDSWYQVREPELPEPRWVYDVENRTGIVTTWGEMKDRTDLARWEYLRSNGTWVSFDHGWTGHPDWPLRVRRLS